MGKKLVLIFLVIALTAGLGGVIGCEKEEVTEKGLAAIDLVPQTANLAASIDLNRIFADDDVMDLINEVTANLEEPQTIDELLDQLVEATGIDLRDFSNVLIFGDSESEDYFGAIVKGDFNQEALIGGIESAVGEAPSTSEYKGYQLYGFQDSNMTLCFLNSNTILGGYRAAVQDAIDVAHGAPSLSGPIHETYETLGDAWVKVAAEVPTAAIEEIPEGIPMDLGMFQTIEAMGISFNKSGVNLSLLVKLLCTDIESAEGLKGVFDFLTEMLSFIPDIPGEVAGILDRLNVEQSGSWLTVSFAATTTEIRDWVQDLGPLFQDMEGVMP